jgi:hypothetical protein
MLVSYAFDAVIDEQSMPINDKAQFAIAPLEVGHD